MSLLIDLGVRYKSAFGYVAANESETLRREKFSEENGIEGVGIFKNDASFENLAIKKNERDSLVFGSMLYATTELKVYAPPPMITIRKSKKLIITEIDGSDSEVVERYGNKSTEIGIEGILVDMLNHRYPKQEVKRLNEFFEYNAPYAVEAERLDDVNVRNIYFTDIDITGVAGYADTIQYRITARSIKPIEFFFVKGNS